MGLFLMNKGEEIDPFLFKLQTIKDQLISMGVKVEDDVMVRTALNAVSDEWERFSKASWVDMTFQAGTTCRLSSEKRKSAE